MIAQKTLTQSMPSAKIVHLFELRKRIVTSLARTRGFLQKQFKTLEDSQASNGGWNQWLEQDRARPSVSGTAQGLITMIACGEPSNSVLVGRCRNFLRFNSESDGSWSTSRLRGHSGLTRYTYLVLRALLDAGEPLDSPAVTNALRWLKDAQNPDGGWGNQSRDSKSDVISTAYSLQVLSCIGRAGLDLGRSISRGREWLLGIRNVDGSWGVAPRKKGQIAHTAEALEALLSCGERNISLETVAGWISSKGSEDHVYWDNFYLESPDDAVQPIHFQWTHVSFERKLAILLALEFGLYHRQVIEAVETVLDRQVNGEHWSISSMPESKPIWAIKDAVISLNRYLEVLAQDGGVSLVNLSMIQFHDRLEELSRRLELVENRQASQFLKKLVRVLKKPGFWVLLFISALVLVYLSLDSTEANIVAGAITIVGTGLGAYQILRSRA